MEDLHEKLLLMKLDFLKKLFPDTTFSVSDGDIINHHLTWSFYDSDYAEDFATLLTCYLNGRYQPCVAECSPGASIKFDVKFL